MLKFLLVLLLLCCGFFSSVSAQQSIPDSLFAEYKTLQKTRTEINNRAEVFGDSLQSVNALAVALQEQIQVLRNRQTDLKDQVYLLQKSSQPESYRISKVQQQISQTDLALTQNQGRLKRLLQQQKKLSRLEQSARHIVDSLDKRIEILNRKLAQ